MTLLHLDSHVNDLLAVRMGFVDEFQEPVWRRELLLFLGRLVGVLEEPVSC